MKPVVLSYKEVEGLKQKHPELVVHDRVDLALEELFDIMYPMKKDIKTPDEVKKFTEGLVGDDQANWGQWIYYPWINHVVHIPALDSFRALRSSRNRNLVSSEEQAKLYNSTILIVGMSVGSNIVEALISQGIGGKLILVDMDIIEPSNLNRIRSPYHHIGLHKVDAISQKVWEIDPFIEIVGYYQGLNEGSLKEIMDNHHVDIVIDEMDELKMKIKLRESAKQGKLPVITAADDGDNSLIDIERYDLDNNLKLFSGRIPEEVLTRIKNEKIPRSELGMMIGKYFVGMDNIPLRMFQSLGEVGKTLPSWPQLGGAAALSGVTLSYVIKKIILNQKIRTGRTLISLDEKLDLEQDEPSYQEMLKKYQTMMMDGS